MNEDYIELKCYIKYNLYYGQKEESVLKALLDAGWGKDTLQKAFDEAKKEPLFPQPHKQPEKVGKFVKHEEKKEEMLPPPPIDEPPAPEKAKS